jgi:hypothetical protein
MEVLQIRVLKILRCKPLSPWDFPLYPCMISVLFNSRSSTSMSFSFDCMKLWRTNFCPHFQLEMVAETHRYPTRTNNEFVISSSRTYWRRNCILVDGLTKFNDLPDSLRHVEPISRFMIELLQHIQHTNLEWENLQGVCVIW